MLLSEMFGVERDVEFEVIGYIGRFFLRKQSDGIERLLWRLKDNDVYVNADLNVVYDIILKAPAGIIHLPPPLTDEQREQLKAIWTLGGRWLVKDDYGEKAVFVFVAKPDKRDGGYWWSDVGGRFIVLQNLCVCKLVSSSDPEPFDIGKALGVE